MGRKLAAAEQQAASAMYDLVHLLGLKLWSRPPLPLPLLTRPAFAFLVRQVQAQDHVREQGGPRVRMMNNGALRSFDIRSESEWAERSIYEDRRPAAYVEVDPRSGHRWQSNVWSGM